MSSKRGSVQLPAAVYVRISADPTGVAAGVQRQEKDCRALAKQKGWTIAEVYVDNDVSAYSGKPRPAYRRMLADLQAGRIKAVAVWHLDRLHRRPVELEEFFEVCDRAGVKHLASVSGDVDLASHDGRFHARIMGAVARKESDDKSRRLQRKMAELAEQGAPGPGGGTRPFGFEADRIAIRADEAKLIREAARRILAGESLHGIVSDWKRRGIKTPTGSFWRVSPLRRVLLSGRIAGFREHHGEKAARAIWKPIIDQATHERLTAIIRRRAADRGQAGGYARSYLLTGFVFCGRCGSKLIAHKRYEPNGSDRRTYTCPLPTAGGCAGIRIGADPLEQLVSEAVLTAVESPAVAKAFRRNGKSHDDGDVEQLRADEEALTQLTRDHYVDRIIGRAEFLSARRSLESRIEEARRRLANGSGDNFLAGVTANGAPVRAAWEQRDLDWRRALLAAVLDRANIGPANVRTAFDPSRVALQWRY